MALANCRECAAQVSTEAASCPRCGVPSPGLTASDVLTPPSAVPVAAAPVSQVLVVAATKSIGISILLTFLFGPLGMLYSTILGAIVMMIASAVIGVFTLGVGLLLTWPISIIWGAIATNSHNRRILAGADSRSGAPPTGSQIVHAPSTARTPGMEPTEGPATQPEPSRSPTSITLVRAIGLVAVLFVVVAGLYLYPRAQPSPETGLAVDASPNLPGSAGGSPRANVATERAVYLVVRVDTGDAAKVSRAQDIIRRRLVEFGVTNPLVTAHGVAGNQLFISLPFGTDVARAKGVISNTDLFEIRLVEGGPMTDEKSLLGPHGGTVPAGMDVVPGKSGPTPSRELYLVRRGPVIAEGDLRSAKSALDAFNLPAVRLTLNIEGMARFTRVTAENVGRVLAIIFGGAVLSAPVIEGQISQPEVWITGTFTQQEVADLSLILRTPLPASVTFLEEGVVK